MPLARVTTWPAHASTASCIVASLAPAGTAALVGVVALALAVRPAPGSSTTQRSWWLRQLVVEVNDAWYGLPAMQVGWGHSGQIGMIRNGGNVTTSATGDVGYLIPAATRPVGPSVTVHWTCAECVMSLSSRRGSRKPVGEGVWSGPGRVGPAVKHSKPRGEVVATRQASGVSLFVAAALLVACGNSTGRPCEHSLHAGAGNHLNRHPCSDTTVRDATDCNLRFEAGLSVSRSSSSYGGLVSCSCPAGDAGEQGLRGHPGSCSADPYLCSLALHYMSATAWEGIGHPSLPNYLAITSGSTQRCSSDGCNTGISVLDLGTQLTGCRHTVGCVHGVNAVRLLQRSHEWPVHARAQPLCLLHRDSSPCHDDPYPGVPGASPPCSAVRPHLISCG